MKTELYILEELDLTDKSVLEVGCGDGRLSKFLISRCKDFYGVDTDKDCIDRAKVSLPKGRFNVANGQDLPYRDSKFDIVIFSKSLHHHPKPAIALQEALRTVKPGGVIIIIELVSDTEYQKILKPVHNESQLLMNTVEAIHNIGIKVKKQRVESPKTFEDLDDLLETLNDKFVVKNINDLKEKAKLILGKRVIEKPLIIDAKLDIYKIEKS